MAKPAVHSSSSLKLRAFFDEAAANMGLRRRSTAVVTDQDLSDSVKRARRARGFDGVAPKSLVKKAAAARKALHNA